MARRNKSSLLILAGLWHIGENVRQQFSSSWRRDGCVLGTMKFRIGFCLVFAVTRVLTGDFLPAVKPWSGASEALIVKPDDPWITHSERTGLTETPSYDETVAYLKK